MASHSSILENPRDRGAWWGAVYGIAESDTTEGTWQQQQTVKNFTAIWETRVRSLGWKDPLQKGKATHSSILAWRMP